MTAPLLQVRDLKKHFVLKPGGFLRGDPVVVHAVDGVSFDLAHGETLSVVGESGSGKSTVGRAILSLDKPTSGEVRVDGKRTDRLSSAELHTVRRRVQVIFQDPFSSLNPRMRIRDILAEPIRNFRIAKGKIEIADRVEALLKRVRMPADAAARYPHEFSGGQRQRIGIARALAAEPDLIVCDEAVSALDMSVKAQIVNLLQDLQDEMGLALLFISHDMAIVEHISHRVAVMYLGKLVEIASRRELFSSPQHPYTRSLLSAIPIADPNHVRNRVPLRGEIPSPINLPTGCRFHTRCPLAYGRCRVEEPKLRELPGDHAAACHLLEESVNTPPDRMTAPESIGGSSSAIVQATP